MDIIICSIIIFYPVWLFYTNNCVYIIIFILLYVLQWRFRFMTYLHEKAHQKTANYFGYESTVILDKDELNKISKTIKKKVNGFCDFEDGERFKKLDFCLIIIAPTAMLLFSIALLIIFNKIYFHSFNLLITTALIFIVGQLRGTKLDVIMLLQVIRYNNSYQIIKYDGTNRVFYYTN